jgi:peptidoglycan LD-endopeptidase CwlK
MMPSFSQRSKDRLATCHPALIYLFNEVIRDFDCTVLEGHRGEAAQNEAFRTGHSHLKWPQGNHNKNPSLAVDVAPYPIDWNNTALFRAFGGYVLGVASILFRIPFEGNRVRVRWGGDWDSDWDFKDQKLVDLPHFEVRLIPVEVTGVEA